MDEKERHDLINLLSPALTYTQNLRLGFYGDLNEKQEAAVRKIEACIKELAAEMHAPARQPDDG